MYRVIVEPQPNIRTGKPLIEQRWRCSCAIEQHRPQDQQQGLLKESNRSGRDLCGCYLYLRGAASPA